MKVLLINGSPKVHGCTYTALEEITKELNKENIDTEILHIGSKPIRGCMACGGCYNDSGKCIFNDDIVNAALDKAAEADGFIFGSPVHYAGPSGHITSFLDRFFYAGDGYQYKPGAVIVSCRRGGSTAAFDQLNKYLTISGMPVVSSQYWNMVHGNCFTGTRRENCHEFYTLIPCPIQHKPNSTLVIFHYSSKACTQSLSGI